MGMGTLSETLGRGMGPRPAEEVLEFDRLREILRRYATCAPGRRRIDQLARTRERAALEAAFTLTGEAIAYLRAGNELGFGSLADPAAWLARLDAPGAVLRPAELLDAASLLDSTASLRETFRAEARRFPLLAKRTATLADFGPLAAAIRRAVLPNGEISDEASSELKRIRTSIARTREAIPKRLTQILRERGAEAGEDYVTMRNDRFVIPVRSSDRRQVEGVVHGSSASGQTVFLEPLEVIELNNKLVQLAEDEAAEIARILRELTERCEQELGALRFAAESIAEFDSLLARARFAREFNATLPEFTSSPEMALEAVRHPVLEDTLRRQGRSIVPITLALGGAETVLVISGPNTGGKTVALKTVGLAALAAQSGIPVTAERAVLPLFDRVLADIGDEQSISADLSTFSAHMLNLKAMLEAATERSLVLADEIGTGTAPEEGSALAVALLEEFRAHRCLTLATTHHDRLKAYASTTTGVLNAAVEFDETNLRLTYRLLVGVPGTSSGIHIARRLGLPELVIERARAQLAPEVREAAELIAYLHRSRDELETLERQAMEQMRQLERERRALQTEWVERQRRRLAELEQKFAEMLKQCEHEISSAFEAVKERELRARLEKQAHRRMVKVRAEAREQVDAAIVQHLAQSQQDLGGAAEPAPQPVTPERLVPGARVRVRGFGPPVVLRRLIPSGGQGRDAAFAEVEAGPLRMKVALDDITAIVSEEQSMSNRGVTVHARLPEEPLGDEINVIGCTVEEATRRVDKFLDQAALAGKPRVRIIHGHGTGALRRGLAEFLSAHPLVEGIRAAEAERGGAAVTLVDLKP
jgi:DNA mismatch repair protein MutS2